MVSRVRFEKKHRIVGLNGGVDPRRNRFRMDPVPAFSMDALRFKQLCGGTPGELQTRLEPGVSLHVPWLSGFLVMAKC